MKLSKKGGMIDKCDVKLDKSHKFNSQDESNTNYLSYQTAVIFFLVDSALLPRIDPEVSVL